MAIEFLTGASVALTAIYAFLTYRILQANRATVRVMEEQAAALQRPYIAVTAGPHLGTIVFVLKISNVGRTAAQKVQLTMDNPFYQFGDSNKNIQAMNAFVGMIDSMPPGFELVFHLGTSIQIYGGGTPGPMPQVFGITADYSDGIGRRFQEKTIVDLRAYYQTAVLEDPAVKELKEIASAIKERHK